MNVGPWWCKANPILIYQGVHCCTNVWYLHLDINPLKSVTTEYLEQDVTFIRPGAVHKISSQYIWEKFKSFGTVH